MLIKIKKSLHKISAYTGGVFNAMAPSFLHNRYKNFLFKSVLDRSGYDLEDLSFRVNYYNKIDGNILLKDGSTKIEKFTKGKSWAYYIDMKKYLLAFDPSMQFFYQPGDIRTVPDEPTFLKSRPIHHDNAASILLKLNRIRHYFFIQDYQPFEQKKNQLVWRGACHCEHRRDFVKCFYRHPLCDVGDSHEKFKHEAWHKGFLSISQQLGYKFILSIEGNDVATNLKWVMASNSLCFMTKPKFETWFMEGTLVPGYHYVLLADDYSDLDDKVQYYIDNPDQAKAIIRNANNYVKPFMNAPREHLIGLLVMQKYFEKTGQAAPLGLGLWE